MMALLIQHQAHRSAGTARCRSARSRRVPVTLRRLGSAYARGASAWYGGRLRRLADVAIRHADGHRSELATALAASG
jgi:hypothetical protein